MEYSYYSTLTAAVPTTFWQWLILIFVITNLKCLPLLWHLRLARSFFAHFPFNKFNDQQSSYVFQPVITSSRSPFLDCDYNLHKSNSSYFTDLDISRGHLLTCLLGSGINRTRLAGGHGGSTNKGRFGIHLGGVTCHFKRELRPFEAFEIWTRVLCWDGKWLYLVSHIVKAGSVKPRSYSLQPWRKVNGRPNDSSKDKRDRPQPVIIASSIAKYVFKRGRLTIAPATVLENAHLLPAASNVENPSSSVSSSVDGYSFSKKDLGPAAQVIDRPDPEAILNATMMDLDSGIDPWDRKRVEAENSRGMKVAAFMAGLEILDREFTGEMQSALGQY